MRHPACCFESGCEWGYKNPGSAGVAFYEGYKTKWQNNVSPNTDWLVMCGTNAGSKMKLVNGADVGTAAGGRGGVSLWVNGGTLGNEKSDFAIAEVVVWPRGLTDDEMRGVSEHLIGLDALCDVTGAESPPRPELCLELCVREWHEHE